MSKDDQTHRPAFSSLTPSALQHFNNKVTEIYHRYIGCQQFTEKVLLVRCVGSLVAKNTSSVLVEKLARLLNRNRFPRQVSECNKDLLNQIPRVADKSFSAVSCIKLSRGQNTFPAVMFLLNEGGELKLAGIQIISGSES